MNEFIEQFLVESREHVEQATADLLALEKEPGNKAVLDSAFRAFHTLKGSAGIVEFDAMARAMHAAEDVLSAARSGSRTITTAILDACLGCLDQVTSWLDAMQSSGEVPAGADARADAVAGQLAAATGTVPDRTTPTAPSRISWAASLLAKHPAHRATALTAVRYVPDPDCFLDHDDPLARVARWPGLLALDAEPATPWPPVDDLDPFLCNLVLCALTRTPRDELIVAIGEASASCEVVALAPDARSEQGALPSARIRDVLQAQVRLLEETGGEGAKGRVASAGAVAVNVLRSARLHDDAGRVADALDAARSSGDATPLRRALESLLAPPEPRGQPATPPVAGGLAARTLRIDASRVDAIVNLTGELTVAKNAVGHHVKLAEAGDPRAAGLLRHSHARLESLVGELQQAVLAMRVLPLRHVFQRFPRLLREMGADSGKPVELAVEGGDTEADKAIVEMLFEPLLHVLRNAMDHGVEDAATRRARGKPPVATIVLRAERVGDQVVVEVGDDGGGIDLARVRSVALERGLLDASSTSSDDEIMSLIFEPGFSTARQVSDVSGRGVGMDTVRTAVHRMGGRVGLQSRAGLGTTVRITLPFSAMMTRVMVVTARGQRFGIPLDAVVETVRVDVDRIAAVGSTHAVALRRRTVPVVSLADALDLPGAVDPSPQATLVVTNLDGSDGALRVDDIGERLEVMLKPLEGLLAGMRGYAGSTLLGDGSVLLILDVAELLR
jgi:two-component system chemotaxis sensor kinase CheA